MKKSELKQLIREEIEKLSSQEYTVNDLHQMILDGKNIQISLDGGHSSSKFNKDGKGYGVMPVSSFERFYLNEPRYKNKTFIQDKTGYFILKGTEKTTDTIFRDYNTGKRFKGD